MILVLAGSDGLQNLMQVSIWTTAVVAVSDDAVYLWVKSGQTPVEIHDTEHKTT